MSNSFDFVSIKIYSDMGVVGGFGSRHVQYREKEGIERPSNGVVTGSMRPYLPQ